MVLDGKKSIKIWWRVHKNYDEDSNKGYILEVDVEYDYIKLKYQNKCKAMLYGY